MGGVRHFGRLNQRFASSAYTLPDPWIALYRGSTQQLSVKLSDSGLGDLSSTRPAFTLTVTVEYLAPGSTPLSSLFCPMPAHKSLEDPGATQLPLGTVHWLRCQRDATLPS